MHQKNLNGAGEMASDSLFSLFCLHNGLNIFSVNDFLSVDNSEYISPVLLLFLLTLQIEERESDKMSFPCNRNN